MCSNARAGEENLDFVESLRSSKRIKLIVTRHEQAAAMMAATVGRLTGLLRNPEPSFTVLPPFLLTCAVGFCMSALFASGCSLPGQSHCAISI